MKPQFPDWWGGERSRKGFDSVLLSSNKTLSIISTLFSAQIQHSVNLCQLLWRKSTPSQQNPAHCTIPNLPFTLVMGKGQKRSSATWFFSNHVAISKLADFMEQWVQLIFVKQKGKKTQRTNIIPAAPSCLYKVIKSSFHLIKYSTNNNLPGSFKSS